MDLKNVLSGRNFLKHLKKISQNKHRILQTHNNYNIGILACLIIITTLTMAGCGGGGSSSDGASTISSGVVVVDSASAASEIAEVDANDDQEVNLTTTRESVLGQNLKVDSVVTVVPGVDDRFPFGLSGKVSSVTTNSDGSVTATLGEATMADVFDSADQEISVTLNADNFIGVIAPPATRATEDAVAAYNSTASARLNSIGATGDSGIKYAINGGIVVRNGTNSSASSQGVSRLAVTELDRIDLNLTVPLADMGIDVSGMDPDAAFVITGSLENLILDHALDFDLISGLKKLEMIVSGQINVEAKLNTSGSTTLGYYSDAWDQVEAAQVDLLGVSAKLTGLDSEDKFGKYPVVGLVWSIPCLNGCTTNIGDTQGAVEMAKLGGVIVWICLDAKGKITLDGEIGARVNSANFSVGVEMPAGGDLDIVYSLTNGGGKRLFELPYINGSGDFAARTGVAIDVDGFALGVRMANVSAELAGNFVAGIEGSDGQLSYGTYELGDDWSWEGSSVCLNADIGAGLIFSASVNAGLEIRSIFFDDYDQSFEYSGQWPSEEEIITPGWHGIGNSTWYTADGVNECFDDSSLASLQ